MEHETDLTTGTAAVFVTAHPAWHGLGRCIEHAATSADAIGLAGLDWAVHHWSVRAFDPEHHSTDAGIPATVAIVNTDTRAVLGVVARRYRVFHNREAFDFMDALVGDELAMDETAGSLHGGRRVWMLARIPAEYRAGPGDLVRPYVLLTNTHDGTQAFRMIPTKVRVVCQNTLNLALREGGVDGLSISHHPRLEGRLAETRAEPGIIAARFDRFVEMHAMLAKNLSVAQAGGYCRGLAGADLPATSQRQKNGRERVLGQLLANFDTDRNTLPGFPAHGLGRVQGRAARPRPAAAGRRRGDGRVRPAGPGDDVAGGLRRRASTAPPRSRTGRCSTTSSRPPLPAPA